MLVCRGLTENLDQKQMTIRARCGRPRKEAQLREGYGVPAPGMRGAGGPSTGHEGGSRHLDEVLQKREAHLHGTRAEHGSLHLLPLPLCQPSHGKGALAPPDLRAGAWGAEREQQMPGRAQDLSPRGPIPFPEPRSWKYPHRLTALTSRFRKGPISAHLQLPISSHRGVPEEAVERGQVHLKTPVWFQHPHIPSLGEGPCPPPPRR